VKGEAYVLLMLKQLSARGSLFVFVRTRHHLEYYFNLRDTRLAANEQRAIAWGIARLWKGGRDPSDPPWGDPTASVGGPNGHGKLPEANGKSFRRREHRETGCRRLGPPFPLSCRRNGRGARDFCGHEDWQASQPARRRLGVFLQAFGISD
jgi:hypothetical protein